MRPQGGHMSRRNNVPIYFVTCGEAKVLQRFAMALPPQPFGTTALNINLVKWAADALGFGRVGDEHGPDECDKDELIRRIYEFEIRDNGIVFATAPILKRICEENGLDPKIAVTNRVFAILRRTLEAFVEEVEEGSNSDEEEPEPQPVVTSIEIIYQMHSWRLPLKSRQ